jgi:hypothetical protein
MPPKAFDSAGFQPTYQSAGFSKWMHASTATLGDMAQAGYFDEAVREGYPVVPGDIIEALGSRGSAQPRHSTFVVDSVDGETVVVSARTNIQGYAAAGSKFFGNETDDNSQFFLDMMSSPGIYTIPVGNWRIPNIEEHRLQPGEYTLIGLDPHHCVLDFSESTARALFRLALGRYRFRFINLGMKGTLTTHFLDFDDWPSQFNALGLDYESIIIDEMLFDNCRGENWEALIHGDEGFGGRDVPPFENQGIGTSTPGNFFTCFKTTVRNCAFLNFSDTPIEWEMGRQFNCQYTGNFFYNMGETGISHGFMGTGTGGRNHLIGPPGINGLNTGTKRNSYVGSPQHPQGDMSGCIIDGNVFQNIGFVDDVVQISGARSTAACLVLCDNVVISNNVIKNVETDSGNDCEGIRMVGHQIVITGNNMLNGGMNSGFIRIATPPIDHGQSGLLNANGESGAIVVSGNILVNTKRTSFGAFAAIGGIDISAPHAIICDNIIEGMTRLPLRLHGMNENVFSDTLQGYTSYTITGNIFRRNNMDGASGSGGIDIDHSHQNIIFSNNLFDRNYGHDSRALVTAVLNPDPFADPGEPPVGARFLHFNDNVFDWDDTARERRCFHFFCGSAEGGVQGFSLRGNVVNECDRFATFQTLDVGATLVNAKITDNFVHTAVTSVIDLRETGTLTPAGLIDCEIYNNPGYMDGAKTHDFGTVNGGETGTTTLTITDAWPGDVVTVREKTGTLAAGLLLHGQVTANNTVTISCSNVTTGNIAVGSKTYDVWVSRKASPA